MSEPRTQSPVFESPVQSDLSTSYHSIPRSSRSSRSSTSSNSSSHVAGPAHVPSPAHPYISHKRLSISSSLASLNRNLDTSGRDPGVSHLDSEEILREGACSRFVPTKGFLQEIKETWRLSWVLIIITFSNYALQPVSTMFGGHLGKLELDALALANSIINILGWATVSGFGTVCDTLFSQTFGSNNPKLMGIYLQRCLILHLFLVLLIAPLFANMGVILLYAGQDPAVAQMTGEYLLIFIPALIAMCFYFVLREYIYTQNIIMPDLFISVSGFLIHVVLQYVMIQVVGWGLTGSAIGQVIVTTYMALATLVYFAVSGVYKKTWSGWSWECLQGWNDIIKLGIYGLCLTCFEWWAFEITIFLAGILGKDQLAAQSIVFNIDMLFYSFASAFGIATSIRVGWNLGANRPNTAISSSTAGMTLSTVAAGFIVVTTLSLKDQLPKMFTNDPDIIKLSASLIPFIAVYTFFDSICGIGRAVLRGTGMQKIGTIFVIITYYCIALPIGLPLMFLTKYELYGIWAAFVLALVLGAIATIIVIFYIFDWRKLADAARIRAGVAGEKTSNETSSNLSHNDQTESERAPLIPNGRSPSYSSVHEQDDGKLVLRTSSHDNVASNNLSVDIISNTNGAEATRSNIIWKILITSGVLLFFGSGIVIRVFVPVNYSPDQKNITTDSYDDSYHVTAWPLNIN